MFEKKLFPGGIHPREGENGKAVNGLNPIRTLDPPPRVIIPLQMHIGAPAKAVVAPGDHVLIGQKIGEAGGFVSASVHASVSGTVHAVQDALLPNGTMAPAVIIDNDYRESWVDLHPTDHPENLSAQELQQIVREAGIVGLGGATFPTAVNLSPSGGKKIEKIVLNGAECEPFLTADHRLMLEKAADIIDGVRLMMLALDVDEALIGIEENKQDAIEIMGAAAREADGVKVVGLPVRYPQGGEKQLVYALTRRQVPNGGLPRDVGVVVCNVGTVYAIDQAIRKGRPLIERITTVGGLVNNPGNFLVRIGTPIDHLIDACGGLQSHVRQFIYGGPMMGMAIARFDIPVTKGCSGLVALGEEAMEPKESPCIKCGACREACPMKLFPSRIDAFCRHDRFEDAEKIGVMNCIECGCCSFVCPAKRSLTQSMRTAKNAIQRKRRREATRKAQEEAAQKAREAAAQQAAEARNTGTEAAAGKEAQG